MRRTSIAALGLLALATACGGPSGDAPTTDAAPPTGDGAPPDDGAPPTDAPTGDGGPPPAPTSSDPVTTPEVGAHQTYDVGPGRAYAEPDTVPWGRLTAGDVVNIYYRPTPYRWKLCLRGSGTAAQPIVVNGVTDASGHRPTFDFAGARTASGCNPGGSDDVFNVGSQWSLEDYAGIMIKPGVGDPYGYKPKWIEIKNLELIGAAPGRSFVSLNGATMPYMDSPAAIWIQPSADILIENNVIHDHGFGVFSMSKDATLLQACERLVIRANRVYGNGVVGSYLEHNLYIQSTNPLIEGNYFGLTRAGSEGSTYKSRSSGEVFRYNYVEASARAIDWVYAEDQTPGIATQSDYGVDYAYGNVIVNDCGLGNCAANPIHYGGDNLGEQEDTATLFTPSTPYRGHLYFYNNTVYNHVDSGDTWRTAVFDLSLRGTTVDAWNNVFAFSGSSNFSWVESAGQLRLGGTNLAAGATVASASDRAVAVNYAVTLGTIVTTAPAFVGLAAGDFRPGAASGAIDRGGAVPAGVTVSAAYAEVPVSRSPGRRLNGLAPRVAHGAAIDLGALEAE